jgi:hypothetical protein
MQDGPAPVAVSHEVVPLQEIGDGADREPRGDARMARGEVLHELRRAQVGCARRASRSSVVAIQLIPAPDGRSWVACCARF